MYICVRKRGPEISSSSASQERLALARVETSKTNLKASEHRKVADLSVLVEHGSSFMCPIA